MITGTNIRLSKPIITYKSDNLKHNREITTLIYTIHDYFKQRNIIYDAEITITNNEYEQIQGKFGAYKKRKDYTFQLRHLRKIILYTDYLEITTTEHTYKIPVGKDFLYFLEWETEYY